MDGGSNLEQIPFGGLLVKSRGIDVVVAVDASADDPNRWPKYVPLSLLQEFLTSIAVQWNIPPFDLPAHINRLIIVPSRFSPDSIFCTKFRLHRRESATNILWVQSESNSGRISTDNLLTQLASSRWKPAIYQVSSSSSPLLNARSQVPSDSTDDMQFSYTPLFTEIFINQAFANTFGGFLPNTTSPDPNWGKCLQCAAIDRARLKLTPPPSRSDVCSQCFSQYCYDPNDPPSATEVPGRNYVFLNPDPGGVTKVQKFLSSNKGKIIGGVVAVVCVVVGAIAFM